MGLKVFPMLARLPKIGGVLNMKKFARFFLLIFILILIIFANVNTSFSSDLAPVEPPLTCYTSGKLSITSKTLEQGKSFTISATNLKPVDVQTKKLYWTYNPNYLELTSKTHYSTYKYSTNQQIVITDAGNHSITLKAKKLESNATNAIKNYSYVKIYRNDVNPMEEISSCKVSIIIPATGISFKTTSKDISVGDKFVISPDVTPQYASTSGITYISSNTAIATVNSSTGEVTAKKVGTVKITAKLLNGKTATLTLHVKSALSSISLNETSKILRFKSYATIKC